MKNKNINCFPVFRIFLTVSKWRTKMFWRKGRNWDTVSAIFSTTCVLQCGSHIYWWVDKCHFFNQLFIIYIFIYLANLISLFYLNVIAYSLKFHPVYLLVSWHNLVFFNQYFVINILGGISYVWVTSFWFD